MSDIQRRPFPLVSSPIIPSTQITDIPLPERSPIAETVGKVAGFASEFIDRYQRAQYASDATDAELEISRRINAYQEALRTNPILPELGDKDDIITKKEKNWQEFSSDIQKNLIGKIGNSQLRDDLTNAWEARSEAMRNNVVNAALDENILYMSDKLNDSINEFSSDILTAETHEGVLFASEGADAAVIRGLESGLINQQQADEYNSFIDRNELLTKTRLEGMTFSESKTAITASNLPLDRKEEAFKILKGEEEAKIAREKEEQAIRTNDIMETGLSAIRAGGFRSLPELEAMYGENGPWDADLDYKEEKELAGAWEKWEKDEADEGIGARKDFAGAVNFWYDNVNDKTKTRIDMLSILGEIAPYITGKTYDKYYAQLDDPSRREKNDRLFKLFEDLKNEARKDGLIDEADEARIQEQFDDYMFGGHLTQEEIQTEVGISTEDIRQWFSNITQDNMAKRIDDLRLREEDNLIVRVSSETFAESVIARQALGIFKPGILFDFISDTTATTEDLENKMAAELGKTWVSMTSDEKERANITINLGIYARKGSDAFRAEHTEELSTQGRDFITGFDRQTGMPTYRIVEKKFDEEGKPYLETVALYSIDFSYKDPRTKRQPEEIWIKWNPDDGLWQSTGETPKIQSPPGFLQKFPENILKFLEGIETGEIPSPRARALEEAGGIEREPLPGSREEALELLREEEKGFQFKEGTWISPY